MPTGNNLGGAQTVGTASATSRPIKAIIWLRANSPTSPTRISIEFKVVNTNKIYVSDSADGQTHVLTRAQFL